MTGPFLLELKNVSKRYRAAGSWILKDIALSLERGEGIVIKGRSGGGKTTLLNIIAGLEPPTGGSVLFQGRDLSRMSDRARAGLRNRRIGYCFQSSFTKKNLTVMENLILPLIIRGEGVRTARKKGSETLEMLELERLASQFPDSLSGGQLQRLSLGRALIGEPDLLLVDEPTGNLDEITAGKILGIILDYHKTHSSSLVLVTHDQLDTQPRLKTYHLTNGKI